MECQDWITKWGCRDCSGKELAKCKKFVNYAGKNNNKYYPYPRFFERYGSPETLEKFPYDEAIKQTVIDTIKLSKQLKDKIEQTCVNCGAFLMSDNRLTQCPICKNNVNININNKTMELLNKFE